MRDFNNMTMRYKKILLIIVILIFLIVFFSCSTKLYEDYAETKENNESVEVLIDETIEVNPETKVFTIDWEHLKNLNSDIIGWIEIPALNINYPILKDNNNLYYMTHSFGKKYNKNGSIFTIDTSPFERKETTIYGHNMRNGTMLSNLGKFLKKDFLYSNLKLRVYTPNNTYEGTIFSVYAIAEYEENENIKNLNVDEKISYYKENSKYPVKIEDSIDKVLKISTCSYENAKMRPTEQRYYIIVNLQEVL